MPRVNVADVDYNLSGILEMVKKAQEQHADLVVFPELSMNIPLSLTEQQTQSGMPRSFYHAYIVPL